MKGMFTLEMPILVLVGESAVGKDRIQNNLINYFNFDRITSHSTRPMRVGESEGNPYYFISKEKMLEFYDNFDLLELRNYETIVDGIPVTWYYAIHENEITRNVTGKRIVIVDAQGLRDLLHIFGNHQIISFYVKVSENIRTKRASLRGSFCEQEWKRRLEDDDREFKSIEALVDFIVDNTIEREPSDLTVEAKILNLYLGKAKSITEDLMSGNLS